MKCDSRSFSWGICAAICMAISFGLLIYGFAMQWAAGGTISIMVLAIYFIAFLLAGGGKCCVMSAKGICASAKKK